MLDDTVTLDDIVTLVRSHLNQTLNSPKNNNFQTCRSVRDTLSRSESIVFASRVGFRDSLIFVLKNHPIFTSKNGWTCWFCSFFNHFSVKLLWTILCLSIFPQNILNFIDVFKSSSSGLWNPSDRPTLESWHLLQNVCRETDIVTRGLKIGFSRKRIWNEIGMRDY